MTTGTVSWATLGFSGTHWQKTARDEDIDLESGEYVPVGHIWKFDLERSKKHLILEWNLIFQNFEWNLSCTIFSRELKKKLEQFQNNWVAHAGKL